MGEQIVLRGPKDEEFELKKGQGLAYGDDGKVEVVDVVEHEGARSVVSDATKRLLVQQMELVKQGNASSEALARSMKDLMEVHARTARTVETGIHYRMDSLDAESYEQLIQEPPTNDWAREVHDAHDKAVIRYQGRCAIAQVRGRPMPRFDQTPEGRRWRGLVSAGPFPMSDEQLKRAENAFVGLVSRGNTWDPDTTTQGGNWAPTGVSASLILAHRLRTSIVQAFPRIDIPRGVHRLDIPTLTGTAGVRVVSATTGAGPFAPQGTQAGNTPATGVMALQAKKHATDPQNANVEEIEDATIAVLDALTAEGFTALGKAQESGLLNAQTTADATFDVALGPVPANGYATSDGATPVGWGIRKYAVAGSHLVNGAAAAFDIDTFVAGLRGMGNFGVNDGQNMVIAIISPKIWFDLLGDTTLRSIDIAGPQATLPAGAITAPFGIPVFVSDQMPDVDANAKAHAAPTSTWAAFVNLNRWKVGMARDAEVRILSPQLEDVAQIRHFARHCIGHAPPATDSSAVVVRNIPNT